MLEIRCLDLPGDLEGLKACVIELQDFEHQLDSRYPDGASIVDAYIPDVLKRSERYEGHILVADVGGEIAGYAMIWARVPPEDIEDGDFECGRLADLVVREKYRGRGIGSRLIAEAEAYARARGVRYLRLGVLDRNSSARALYKSLGYSNCLIEMEKDLGDDERAGRE